MEEKTKAEIMTRGVYSEHPLQFTISFDLLEWSISSKMTCKQPPFYSPQRKLPVSTTCGICLSEQSHWCPLTLYFVLSLVACSLNPLLITPKHTSPPASTNKVTVGTEECAGNTANTLRNVQRKSSTDDRTKQQLDPTTRPKLQHSKKKDCTQRSSRLELIYPLVESCARTVPLQPFML